MGKRTRSNFHSYGNLAFYPDKNAGSVDLTNNFFYFNSLLQEEDDTKSDYTVFSNQIGKNAQKALNYNAKSDEDKEVFFQDLDKIIDLLQKGVQIERANEIIYARNKLKEIDNLFPPEVIAQNEQLKNIQNNFLSLINNNSTENFDEKSYILSFNTLKQGFNNTKQIISQEIKRDNLVQNAIDEAHKSWDNSNEGLEISQKRQHISHELSKLKRERQIRLHYLTHTTLTDSSIDAQSDRFLLRVKRILNDKEHSPQTSGVTIAHWLTDTMVRIVDSDKYVSEVAAIIKDHLIKNNGNMDAKQLENLLKENLISTFLKFAVTGDNMSRILENPASITDKEIEDLISQSLNLNQQINYGVDGMYANFGLFGNTLKLFTDGGYEKVFDTTVEYIKRIEQKLRRNNNAINKLTPQEQIAYKLLTRATDAKANNLQKEFVDIKQLNKIIRNLQILEKKDQEINKQVIGKFKVDDTEIPIYIQMIQSNKASHTQIQFTTVPGREKDLKSFLKACGIKRTSRAQTLHTFIAGLKTQASHSIGDYIRALSKTQTLKVSNKKSTEFYKILEKQLGDLHISIGGPIYDEIFDALREHTLEQAQLSEGRAHGVWHAKFNLKNDLVIYYYLPYKKIALELAKNIQPETKNFEEAINRKFIEMHSKIQQQFQQTVEVNMEKISKNKDYTDFVQQAEAFYKADQQRAEQHEQLLQELIKMRDEALQLTNSNEERQKIWDAWERQAQAFLNIISDELVESETTKTLNTALDSIGFVGGSLGQDIVAQVDHLKEIFEKAGIIIDDNLYKWLINAAINSNPVSVMQDSKHVVENYLGSLAIFAMFNEGGAELKYLMENVENKGWGQHSNILHVYHLNNMYYPGSLVLQHVLDNVKLIQNELTQVADKDSQRNVILVNTVNYGIIPNKDRSNPPETTTPWQDVSKSAIARTDLKVIFMGGIMDMLKALQEALKPATAVVK